MLYVCVLAARPGDAAASAARRFRQSFGSARWRRSQVPAPSQDGRPGVTSWPKGRGPQLVGWGSPVCPFNPAARREHVSRAPGGTRAPPPPPRQLYFELCLWPAARRLGSAVCLASLLLILFLLRSPLPFIRPRLEELRKLPARAASAWCRTQKLAASLSDSSVPPLPAPATRGGGPLPKCSQCPQLLIPNREKSLSNFKPSFLFLGFPPPLATSTAKTTSTFGTHPPLSPPPAAPPSLLLLPSFLFGSRWTSGVDGGSGGSLSNSSPRSTPALALPACFSSPLTQSPERCWADSGWLRLSGCSSSSGSGSGEGSACGGGGGCRRQDERTRPGTTCSPGASEERTRPTQEATASQYAGAAGALVHLRVLCEGPRRVGRPERGSLGSAAASHSPLIRGAGGGSP
ncbi:hypothetical protein GHT09_011564 [Marmota monax]|uniref:Uncharacterized protein n=1 Tax=Marmota monax TaxID=9995 RepID=A0A834QDA6_MARMO|nr:hypothetical protein GHT09_011564 [Marmota monax]